MNFSRNNMKNIWQKYDKDTKSIMSAVAPKCLECANFPVWTYKRKQASQRRRLRKVFYCQLVQNCMQLAGYDMYHLIFQEVHNLSLLEGQIFPACWDNGSDLKPIPV